jgi:hypothetical protein
LVFTRREKNWLGEIVIHPELAGAIRSDPAAFQQFVGQQVMDSQRLRLMEEALQRPWLAAMLSERAPVLVLGQRW